MILREYEPSDCWKMAELFYTTVHSVNAKDYSADELNAWAPGMPDLEVWNTSFLKHITYVAMEKDELIGFGDMDETGYLDRLYVHKDHLRQGIATTICDVLEQTVHGQCVITHASITAVPFFTQRGYRIVRKQEVIRNGVSLTNYVMQKEMI